MVFACKFTKKKTIPNLFSIYKLPQHKKNENLKQKGAGEMPAPFIFKP